MEISGLYEGPLTSSFCDAVFMCVIHIFMLFPSLRFLYGLFRFHLGIGLQSLEAGRFFQWDWAWAHYLYIGNPLMLVAASSVQ